MSPMTRHYFGSVERARAKANQGSAAAAPPPVDDFPTAPDEHGLELPRVLFGPQVAKLLGISLATFHALRKSGTFPVCEIVPRLDRRPRFSRDRVLAYIRGELIGIRGGNWRTP